MSETLAEFEAAIAPGVTERDLFAVLASGMLGRGAEYMATNTVCSGPNTNPWRAEATDRALEPGDLVYVDTDTVGIEGIFFCVSRTFVTPGAEPTADARSTYQAAHEWVLGMTELVRPGITCAELAAAAPKIPERFVPQRYECMIHSVGLEEESPSVCHPQDVQSNPDRVIQENMALVVECYMGEVGGSHGVKLGDEILVTASGAEVLAPYPYAGELLVSLDDSDFGLFRQFGRPGGVELSRSRKLCVRRCGSERATQRGVPPIAGVEPGDQPRQERVAAAHRISAADIEPTLEQRPVRRRDHDPVRASSHDTGMPIATGEISQLRGRGQRLLPPSGRHPEQFPRLRLIDLDDVGVRLQRRAAGVRPPRRRRRARPRLEPRRADPGSRRRGRRGAATH